MDDTEICKAVMWVFFCLKKNMDMILWVLTIHNLVEPFHGFNHQLTGQGCSSAFLLLEVGKKWEQTFILTVWQSHSNDSTSNLSSNRNCGATLLTFGPFSDFVMVAKPWIAAVPSGLQTWQNPKSSFNAITGRMACDPRCLIAFGRHSSSSPSHQVQAHETVNCQKSFS